MKPLFGLLFGCLLIVGCTCDGEIYCDGQNELQMGIPVLLDGFTQRERDSCRMIVHLDSNDLVIADYKIGRYIRFNDFYGEHLYRMQFPYIYNNGDIRDQYCVFKINEFTDTIRNFYYETRDTTLSCSGGCNNNYSGTQDFTIYDNFYFLHKGDTIQEGQAILIDD